jgi:hypothetical protein
MGSIGQCAVLGVMGTTFMRVPYNIYLETLNLDLPTQDSWGPRRVAALNVQ